MNFRLSSPRLLVLVLLCFFSVSLLQAQEAGKRLRLSLGATLNYATSVTFDGTSDAGLTGSLTGDLQYGQLIGQLQGTSAFVETFSSSRFLSGWAIHGSLGYAVKVTPKFQIPVMLTGGAAFLTYEINDVWWDGSPQIGLTVAPYYEVVPHVAIQGIFRFLKGWETNMDNEAIDMTDLGIGLKVRF